MLRPRVAVCGSFRRSLPDVVASAEALQAAGAEVLSPQGISFSGNHRGFVYLEGDRSRIVRAVEARHLHAIEMSSFVWLVAPGGYVGTSAIFELAWATRAGVPVLCKEPPADLMLASFTELVPSEKDAVTWCGREGGLQADHPTMAFAPHEARETAHRNIESIYAALVDTRRVDIRDDLVSKSAETLRRIVSLL